MKTGLKLIIVVALQSLAILAMVGGKVQTLMTGDVIILRTAPVDPRSLFRGDFVRLRYEITRLAGDEVSFDLDDLHPGRTIYVRLREEKGAWGAVSVHGKHPGSTPDFKVIRGRIAASDMEDLFSGRRESAQRIPPARRKPPVRVLIVYYGIEAYFVPEGTGRALERPPEGQTMTVAVAVDGAGRAAISGLLLDGKLVHDESLF